MTDIGREVAEPSEFRSPERSEFCRDTADELTLEDLAQPFVEEGAVVVRDVMTPVVYQVPASAPVAKVARIMIEHHGGTDAGYRACG